MDRHTALFAPCLRISSHLLRIPAPQGGALSSLPKLIEKQVGSVLGFGALKKTSSVVR